MIPSVVNSPNLTSTQVIRPPKLNALLEETSIIKFAGLFLETDRYKLPKATKLELIKQLSNPAITAKKIESKRQAIEELSKIDTAQLLNLVKAIFEFNIASKALQNALFQLDSRHYPIRNPVHAPDGQLYQHNKDGLQPFPENASSLVKILDLYIKGQKIFQALPDIRTESYQRLKRRIGAIVNAPYLATLVKTVPNILQVVETNPNPFLLMDLPIHKLEMYSREKRSFEVDLPTDAQEALKNRFSEEREYHVLVSARKEFAELCLHLEQIWNRDAFLKSPEAVLRHFSQNLLSHLSKLDIQIRSAIQLSTGKEFFARLSEEQEIHLTNFKPQLIYSEEINPLNLQFNSSEGGINLSGTVCSGRTTILHSALLATLINQIGLPLRTSEAATIGIFDNFYASFPQAHQIDSGDGLFGSSLKKIPTTVTPRSLVILDSIPAGTDSKGLTAVGLTAISSYQKAGATVLINSPSRELSKAIADHSKLRTLKTERLPSPDLPPSALLINGYAERAEIFELAENLDFPPQVINNARKRYQALKLPAQVTFKDQEISDRLVDNSARYSLPIQSRIRLLKRLEARFPERFFGLKDSRLFLLRDLSGFPNLLKRDQQPRQYYLKGIGVKTEADHYGEVFTQKTSVAKQQREARKEIISLLQTLDPQVREGIKELIIHIAEQVKAIINATTRSTDLSYEAVIIPIITMHQDFQKSLSSLMILLESSFPVAEFQRIKDVFQFSRFLNDIKVSASLTSYEMEEKEKYGEAKLLYDAYYHFYLYKMDDFIPLILQLDQLNALASISVANNLKAANLIEETMQLSAVNMLPVLPINQKTNLEIKISNQGVSVLDPSPISFQSSIEGLPQAILGPNSSGKSTLIEALWLEAYLAINGYPTSGDFSCSDFGEIYTFFGANNSSVINSDFTILAYQKISYILNNVKAGDLVLLDELPGSDPEEIACLQQAIANYAREKKFLLIFNTHHRNGLLESIHQGEIVAWKSSKIISKNPNSPVSYEIIPDPGLTSESNPLEVVREIWPEDLYRKVLAQY